MQCCLRAQSHNKRQENLSLRLIRFAVCALVRRERIERMHVVLQDAREVRRTSLCRLGATYHCDSRRILTSPSALAGPIHATSSSGSREYVKRGANRFQSPLKIHSGKGIALLLLICKKLSALALAWAAIRGFAIFVVESNYMRLVLVGLVVVKTIVMVLVLPAKPPLARQETTALNG